MINDVYNNFPLSEIRLEINNSEYRCDSTGCMCMDAYKMNYFLTQLKSCFWTLTKNDMADKRFSFVTEVNVQK